LPATETAPRNEEWPAKGGDTLKTDKETEDELLETDSNPFFLRRPKGEKPRSEGRKAPQVKML